MGGFAIHNFSPKNLNLTVSPIPQALQILAPERKAYKEVYFEVRNRLNPSHGRHRQYNPDQLAKHSCSYRRLAELLLSTRRRLWSSIKADASRQCDVPGDEQVNLSDSALPNHAERDYA